MSITCGTDVTWTRPGRTVEGTAGDFVNVHTPFGWVLAASVLVTADAGLYHPGDVVTVAVAELEAVA